MNDIKGPKTTRIVFIGGPGCGKSTASADLFITLKKLGKNTELVPEWVRRDIMINGPMNNVFEQYRYLAHNKREESHFADNVEYIVQDGGRLLGYFYASFYSTRQDKKEKLVISDLYNDLLDTLYSGYYDRIYFLPRAPVAQTGGLFNDGTRYQTTDDADALEDYMKMIFTKIHRMDSVRVVSGPLDQRIELILKDLEIREWIPGSGLPVLRDDIPDCIRDTCIDALRKAGHQ